MHPAQQAPGMAGAQEACTLLEDTHTLYNTYNVFLIMYTVYITYSLSTCEFGMHYVCTHGVLHTCIYKKSMGLLEVSSHNAMQVRSATGC